MIGYPPRFVRIAKRWGLRAKLPILVGVLLAALGTLRPAPLLAAGGVTVAPSMQEVLLFAKEHITTFQVQVSNDSEVEQSFNVSILDFRALDETGGVAFVGLDASKLEKKYSLANWARLEPAQIRLAAGQSQSIKVTIENRDDLRPGGHYGAVIVRQISRPAGSDVTLEQASASLIFLRKAGGEKESLDFSGLIFDRRFLSLPSKTELRLYNSGSVHLNPRGVIRLLDPKGREVARAALNESSGIILPETYRRYITPMTKTRESWLPGRYTLEVNYRYDGKSEFATAYRKIWAVPGRAVVAIFLMIMVLVMLWRYLGRVIRLIRRLLGRFKLHL